MLTPASSTNLRYEVTVLHCVRETTDVVTLYLARSAGFAYVSGQYVTVFFDDTDVPEGKAYSLSSCPSDPHLSITIKRVGLFSGKLHALKAGDTVVISPAYGMFNAFGDRPLVALAAGVGIAPIYSIIRDELSRRTHREIQLFYTNTTDEAIVFHEALAEYAARAAGLIVHHTITRQPTSVFSGPRLDGQAIAARYPDYDFCVCGQLDFVRDMRHQLLAGGANDDHIMTEIFFEAGR